MLRCAGAKKLIAVMQKPPPVFDGWCEDDFRSLNALASRLVTGGINAAPETDSPSLAELACLGHSK